MAEFNLTLERVETGSPLRNSAPVRNSAMGGKGPGSNSIWFLTGQVSDRESVRHIAIHSSPFRIGRRSDLALSIPCSTVSSVHAELIDMGDHLVLRDRAPERVALLGVGDGVVERLSGVSQ